MENRYLPGMLYWKGAGQSVWRMYDQLLEIKVFAFWAKEGSGAVLIGEVSQCNDDNTDNRFLEPMGRFPQIEEDEPPLRLLCTEYPSA